jgi:hypothetical protein
MQRQVKNIPCCAGEGRDGVADPPDCPHQKLIDLYHELLPTCTKVVEWNGERQALMRARWREQAVPNGKRPGYATEAAGLAFWRRYFGYVSQSNFLTGTARAAPRHRPSIRGDAGVARAAEELREGRRGELPPLTRAPTAAWPNRR